MVQLAGKVALITGASKGVGRVMSRLFAAEGAAVICAARSRDLVEETTALVNRGGGRAIAAIGDAAIEADVQRMVEAGVKEFGKLDTLVNNAGDGGVTKPVQDYSMEDWRYTIDSCLTSSYLCTRFAVPEMIKAGGGAIVNISSGAGRRGLPYRIGYCSAKAGQVGGISVEQMRKAFVERSPLKRMVTADDIVDATVFFCSDMARSVSGQVLAVNAGESAG